MADSQSTTVGPLPQDPDAMLLWLLAARVLTAHLETGMRVVDVLDCSQWLRELAEKLESGVPRETLFQNGSRRHG